VEDRTREITIKNEELKNTLQVRKQAEEALQRERDKLQDALSEVKTLQGILPICSYCKKIRDDQGYWQKVEKYVHDRSGAEFSHGVCPECAKKHWGDYLDAEE
jgi:hypothetical protein